MQATAPCAPNARRPIWVKARPIRPALPRPQQQQCIRSRMAAPTQQSKPNEQLAPPQSHAHARAQVQFKFKCKRKRRTSRRQAPSPWGGRGRERDGQEGNNEEEKMAKKGKEGDRRSKLKSAKEQGIVLGGARPQQCKKPASASPGAGIAERFRFPAWARRRRAQASPGGLLTGTNQEGRRGKNKKAASGFFWAPTASRTAPAQTRANQSVKPPVISIAAPLMYLASSEAKNANRLAISSGSAKRRAGILAANLSKTS